ncbi:MAG: FtsX-like permease family protein [Bryobacteraceae bacterium]
MLKEFELIVAFRYLRAKRKQAVISVITVISIIGVAAGVMALVIALGINNGFRGTLQRNLLGATAHVSVLEKERGYGIENWRDLTSRMSKLPHVIGAAPSLYGQVMMAGPQQSTGAILKGIDPDTSARQSEILANLKHGSLSMLNQTGKLPGIILGSRLAQNTGMMMGSVIRVINPQGDTTPYGVKVNQERFRVVGIFESGFYELDATWAYTSLKAAQLVLSVDDVVNTIELKVDDIYAAPEIALQSEKLAGPKLYATHWMDQNKPILSALKMEKTVTVITIGLIQLVGALNILIALVMMVMEKYKDIAVLMSLGARHQQIRRIFQLQGVLIGAVGSFLGLAAGYTLCYLANRYQWIRLDQEVYSLSFVPFEPRLFDAIWIAAIAIGVSFLATFYPARSATRIAPVEALRYE